MANLSRPAAAAEPQTELRRDDGHGLPVLKAAPSEIVARGDKFIAAAYELLNECGLDGLTVRAVLKQAGLNRRSFYERFSTKDDLVLAVFEQSIRSVADECRREMTTLRDPMEVLRFMVRYLVLADTADPTRRVGAAMCREHMRLAEARPDELRAALQPLIAVFAEQLAAGAASNQVRDCDPGLLANFVYNLVSTTVHAEVLAAEAGQPGRRSRGELADNLWEFCSRAIRA